MDKLLYFLTVGPTYKLITAQSWACFLDRGVLYRFLVNTQMLFSGGYYQAHVLSSVLNVQENI